MPASNTKSPAESKTKRKTKSGIFEGPVITRDYIVNHIGLPNLDEFPDAPTKLQQMLERSPGGIDNKAIRKLFRNHLKAVSPFQVSDTGHAHFPVRTKFTASLFNKENIAIFGDGQRADDSGYHAFLHLVAQLYKRGYLASFYKPEVPRVVQRMKPDPKVAVYEYAARRLLLPTFKIDSLQPETRDIMLRHGNIPTSIKFQCTLELPEQGIIAIGAGGTPYLAEVAASVRFLDLIREHKESVVNESLLPQEEGLFDVSLMQSYRNFCNRGHDTLNCLNEKTSLPEENNQALCTSAVTYNQRPTGQTVKSADQHTATGLALLTAFVTMVRDEPALLSSFKTALDQGDGKVLREIPPLILPMPRAVRRSMQDTIDAGSKVPEIDEPLPSKIISSNPSQPLPRKGTGDPARRNRLLQEAFRNYQSSPATESKRRKREELPINQHRPEILNMVTDNPIAVVVGATGSGKTTQVPQMFLEAASEMGQGAACNVICTQPRRIAATSVARRVADERNELLGDSVGFAIRGNSIPPRGDGSVLFCTTGTLLQRLKANADEVFDATSHIILDEVHERDSFLDYLLIVLKKALKQRAASKKPVPKVVLMSATMDTELFSNYFGVPDAAGKLIPCPTIQVPGKLFPVQHQYLQEIHNRLQTTFHGHQKQLVELFNEKNTRQFLENELRSESLESKPQAESEENTSNGDPSLVPVGLIAATVAHVAKTTNEGAILVFLPGEQEILATRNLLTRNRLLDIDFGNEFQWRISVLHSSTPAEAQAAVFEPVPKGCRKVILSTNIAETSVTIPDIQHVIDSGKLREIQYDPIERITALKTCWVSKANAKQRAGRAGRVQDGNYYGMYTEERLEKLKVAGTAELLRSDLQKICLDVKANGLTDSVADFLSQAIEPPKATNVQLALSGLRSIKALTKDEELTPLGQLMSKFPVEPALAKMILFGIIFRCLDTAIILSALSGSRSLFAKPSGLRSQWEPSHQKWLGTSQSEHIAQIRAYKYLRHFSNTHTPEETRRHMGEKFFSHVAFTQIKRTADDIRRLLVQNGFISPSYGFPDPRYELGNDFDNHLDENSNDIQMIKVLTLVGCAPNVAMSYGKRWFRNATSDEIMVHPKSILSNNEGAKGLEGAIITYSTMASGDDAFLSMREVTQIPPATALLFGGQITSPETSTLQLLGWLSFKTGFSEFQLITQFLATLDRVCSSLSFPSRPSLLCVFSSSVCAAVQQHLHQSTKLTCTLCRS